MGVVYKLTPEIIDFILHQKKENPRLSCRKLTDVVNQTFQIAVSKSSVNKILKESALSSPVGRRNAAKGGFKIPETKKQQIFGSTQSSKPPAPSAPKKETSPKDSPLHSDREKRPAAPEGVFIDGAGTYFLKAAQWEAAEGPILGPLLKEYLTAEGLTDATAAGEILLFMECFGISHLSEIGQYGKKGLWEVADLVGAVDRASLEKIINDVDNLNAFAIRLSIELPQIFSEMHMIELELEDGSVVRTDVNMGNFYGTETQRNFIAAPVNKALSILVGRIINNVQSALILFASSRQELDPMFFNWVAAMENIAGKRIRKAAVRDLGGHEVVHFHTILPRKRTFVAGIWPWHDTFHQIIEEGHIEKVDSAYLKEVERKLYFREVSYSLQSGEILPKGVPLRAILLRETMESAPFLALLSNAPKTVSATQVVAAFFQKWPHLPKGESISELEKRARIQEAGIAPPLSEIYHKTFGREYHRDSPGFFGIIGQILRMLSIYAQRYYFEDEFKKSDISYLISIIYGINGYLKKEKNTLKVTLAPPPNYPYFGQLEKAVQRVNEQMIFDPQGRRLFMKIFSPAFLDTY